MEPRVRTDVTATPVTEFFAGRGVFVTGGTGFVGKVLVEKLLRSCPKVKVIYLLVRPKRGVDLSTRLQHVINCQLFDRLREENPSQLEKIIAVGGDITEAELGLSPSDQDIIREAVSVVFHCAATIRFNEPLKEAVKVNLLGTKHVLDLCKRMNNLAVMVHVSTCYSNCDLDEIKEVVYPPPYDPESFAKSMEWMDDEVVDTITPSILRERPNTYVLTKAMAEHLVSAAAKDFPITIVRPSGVASSFQEPMPGWIQGYGAATGAMAAYFRGLLRTFPCGDPRHVLDLIPIDMVVNVMICAAWRTAASWCQEVTVYNSCSGATNPLTIGQWFENMSKAAREYPTLRAYCAPAENMTQTNEHLHRCNQVLFQILPAYLQDGVGLLTGQSPRMVRNQKLLAGMVDSLSYFFLGSFNFKDDKVRELLKLLHPDDQKTFNFDISVVKWDKYISEYMLGIRQFLFRDNPDTVLQAMARLRRMYWRNTLFCACAVISTAYLFLRTKL